MTRSSRVLALRALFDAFGAHDARPLMARLDSASVLHIPGHSGLGGDYHGPEAIVGVITRISGTTDGTLVFEVRETSEPEPDGVRAVGDLSGRFCGRAFDMPVSVDATISDELLRSITIECADREAWDRIWGGAVA